MYLLVKRNGDVHNARYTLGIKIIGNQHTKLLTAVRTSSYSRLSRMSSPGTTKYAQRNNLTPKKKCGAISSKYVLKNSLCICCFNVIECLRMF